MAENKLYNTVDELLRNPKELASMSAKIRGTQIRSQMIDQFIYPIGGTIIEIKREADKSLKESFTADFIHNLYRENEWNTDVLDEISEEGCRKCTLLFLPFLPIPHLPFTSLP